MPKNLQNVLQIVFNQIGFSLHGFIIIVVDMVIKPLHEVDYNTQIYLHR